MELFDREADPLVNLLPMDGIVNYYGKVVSADEANVYLRGLLEGVEWRPDEAIIYGKRVVTKREVAWYGDEAYAYTYSKTTKHALSWTKELRELKRLVEEKSGEKFNSCLLN